jgi:hypothetical protein
MCTWPVADRSSESCDVFIADLASRLAHRIQTTTDSYPAYIESIGDAFGWNVDYAMLVKEYGTWPQQSPTTTLGPTRHSAPRSVQQWRLASPTICGRSRKSADCLSQIEPLPLAPLD